MRYLAAMAAFAALTSAHMIMQSPAPYNPAPNNSPLQPGGGDFPCKKGGSGFTVKEVTKATVGQTVKLAFTGSAVHNGGSCQVSLTKDGASALNANSNFKVIYSILGGCPGLSGGPTTYDVPIPNEVPAGDYTFAWSWFNNIGNREFYMNCAPIAITGGSGSPGSFDSLPDMAVYNIASKNACKTEETYDVDFPNPGKYVLKSPSFKPKPPTCNGIPAQGGSGGIGSGFIGAQPTPAKVGTGSPTQTYNDGKWTPQASAPSPAPSAAVPNKPSSNTGNNGFANPPSVSAAPAAPPLGAGRACSNDGALVCSQDGNKFGLCNWGTVQFMAVAEGTKCENGSIVTKNKRGLVKKLFQA